MSRNPRLERWETRCSIEGRFTIGMQGFGRSNVSGLSRVPSPPHMMHTFIPERITRITFKPSGTVFLKYPGRGNIEIFFRWHPHILLVSYRCRILRYLIKKRKGIMFRRTIPKSVSAWTGIALAIFNRRGVHIRTILEICCIHAAPGLIPADYASSGLFCKCTPSTLRSLHNWWRHPVSYKRAHCRISTLNTAKEMRKNHGKIPA